MDCKAYIFDFDYTLGDSTRGIVSSINYALEMLGRPAAPEDDIRRTVGFSLTEAFRMLTGAVDVDEAAGFVKFFRVKADEVMTESTVLFPDAAETLERLRARGARTGIVSTKRHSQIADILKYNNKTSLVDEIIGGDDVLEEKPRPEGLLKILELLKVSGDNVLYIGDSVVDARTAMNAGVRFVAVTTGTTPGDVFEQYPHCKIIEKLGDLLYIKESEL